MTVTRGACPADTGRAERLAGAESGAGLERVPAGLVPAVVGLVKLFERTLGFGCGR